MFPLLIIRFSNFSQCRTVLPLVVGVIIPPEDRVPVFKLPDGPPELRHAWTRALHRDDIADLKTVYVCAKHFQKEDIQYFHTVPRGDGTSYEVPRGRPKLNPGAVLSLLPGCPSLFLYPFNWNQTDSVLLRLQRGRFIEPSN